MLLQIFVVTMCFCEFGEFGHLLPDGDNYAERKLFIKYCFISFTTSLVRIGANLVVSESKIDYLRFGYGGSKCFLKRSLTLLIIFNITMFSITFHFIRNTPKVQSSKERKEISIS